MRIQIKVIPNSSIDGIVGWLEDSLKVKVKAPAEKGKANNAVIKVLEKKLGLAKGLVSIKSGTNSSRKVLEIRDCDIEEIKERLKTTEI